MSNHQVFVVTINGKTVVIDVSSQSVTAFTLKTLIEQKEGIPPVHQRLISNGKSLCRDSLITSGAIIHLSVF